MILAGVTSAASAVSHLRVMVYIYTLTTVYSTVYCFSTYQVMHIIHTPQFNSCLTSELLNYLCAKAYHSFFFLFHSHVHNSAANWRAPSILNVVKQCC